MGLLAKPVYEIDNGKHTSNPNLTKCFRVACTSVLAATTTKKKIPNAYYNFLRLKKLESHNNNLSPKELNEKLVQQWKSMDTEAKEAFRYSTLRHRSPTSFFLCKSENASCVLVSKWGSIHITWVGAMCY